MRQREKQSQQGNEGQVDVSTKDNRRAECTTTGVWENMEKRESGVIEGVNEGLKEGQEDI